MGFILQYKVEKARTGSEVDGSEIQSRSILPHPFHCPVIGWEIAWQFMANHAGIVRGRWPACGEEGFDSPFAQLHGGCWANSCDIILPRREP
jgi:hypothetical protein